MILVTGGAGFTRANFVVDWLRVSDKAVLNLDKFTHAGDLKTQRARAHRDWIQTQYPATLVPVRP